MKKLMTMIAAVATAFGLYTANAFDGTSFETQAEGVTENTWAPPDGGVWTTDITDAFDLGAYDNDKYDYGTHARRDAKFENGEGNVKYLKLETGSETLNRTIDGTDKIYFDQVVKFTGFEEPQTFTGEEKIAVWMSNYEDDDTTVDVDEAETALYVAVGTADPTAPIKSVKLNKTVADDTWYRVTIKSLGAVDENRAGFRVWIDGEEVGIVEADKNYYQGELTDAAKKFDAAGKLFVAMDDTSATLAKVSYKGLGSIDDVIVSQDAPDFDAQIPFAVTHPDGVEIVSLVAGGEELEADKDGKYWVMPNTEVTFNLKAADGYRLDLDDPIKKNVTDDVDLTDDLEGKVIEGYATLNGAVVGEDELTDMMAGLTDGDKVVFLKDSEIGDNSFGAETTIDVVDGVLTIAAVGDLMLGEIDKNITIDADSDGDVYISGDIDAGMTVDASELVYSLYLDGNINVAGTLKVADDFKDQNNKITLVGAGKVWSFTQLLYEGDNSIFANEEKIAETEDEDVGYNYTIAAADYVAQIGDDKFETLNEAFAAAKTGDTIEMLADVTLSERIFIGSADGDKDITLDLAGKTITWDASVANASGVLIVCSGSKLTVNDKSGTNAGKIDANGEAYAAIAVTHKNYQDAEKTASLIVNGGTLIGYYQGIVGNGKRPNTYVEINGGVITATAADSNLAIYNPQGNSTVVINGGTLIGLDSAIEMRGGTLTVNGGTLTATSEEYVTAPNGSGNTTKGAAVAVSQHTTKGDIAVEIKGGTLAGLNAVSVANPQGNTTDNVAVTLGAATYNGALAFSADENATVTNNGSGLAAPEGYKWDTDGKLYAKYNGDFTIASVRDLKDLQADVAAGQTFAGVTFTQTADIALTEAWAGIGVYVQAGGSTSVFKGTYDGQNHKITNVVMADNGSGKNNYRGFFNQIEGGAVSNLTVVTTGFGENPPTGEYGCAAIVGHAYNTTIENCIAEGTIASAKHNAAGIVIRLTDATVKNCTNKANITGNYTKVAGIACLNQDDKTGSLIDGCVNEGNITCANNTEKAGRDGCAGILAWVGAANKMTIKDCSNTGTIAKGEGAVEAARLGQIVGWPQYAMSVAGTNTGMADGVCGVGTATVPAGLLSYATVDGNVATFVTEFEAGKTYKLMAAGLTPTFEFTAAGTIAFDEALVEVADEFKGITAGDESLNVTSDKQGTITTFTAALKEFTVTYMVDGAKDSEEKVVWGESPIAIPTPAAKTGYTGEWDKDPATAVIKADETFTYTYTAEEYDIEYTFTGVEDADKNKIQNPNTTVKYTVEDAVAFEAATCDGYEFKGWNPTEITKGTTGKQTIVGTFEKKAAYPSYIPLTDAEAKGKWDAWIADKKVDDAEATVVEDAFLLNCALDQVEIEKAKFVIKSITQDANGDWVFTVVDGEHADGDAYGNGYIQVVPYTDITVENGQLFKAELVVSDPKKN